MSEDLRRWRIEDSIPVRYVSDHFFVPLGTPTPDTVSPTPYVLSPDGQRFFFLSFRGDLSHDGIEYELDVFETAALEQALTQGEAVEWLAPSARCKVICTGAADNVAGVAFPAWIDEHRIAFMSHAHNTSGAYEFDVSTKRLRRLVEEQHDIAFFSTSSGSIVYICSEMLEDDLSALYPVARVSTRVMIKMFRDWGRPRRVTLRCSYRGRRPRIIQELQPEQAPGGSQFSFNGPLWISPDGKLCFVLITPPSVPAYWSTYSNGSTQTTPAYQFRLLDVASGRFEPALDAPWGMMASTDRSYWGQAREGVSIAPQVFWSSDSRNALIVNTALPLNGEAARASTSYIVGLNISSGQYEPLAPLSVHDGESVVRERIGRVGWRVFGRELVATRETPNGERLPGLLFTATSEGWAVSSIDRAEDPRPSGFELSLPATPPVAVSDGVDIRLEQSQNDPPRMMARRGRVSVALQERDPALAGIERRPVQEVQWRDPDGEIEKGGLVTPVGAGPFPIVVQAFHYSPDVFLPDGISTMAHATQAFAAAGIAVLAINIPGSSTDRRTPSEIWDTPREMPYFVERIDAAIASLPNQASIDVSRVGLIGHSRGAAATTYAVTHPGRTKISASIAAEGLPLTFSDYMSNVLSHGRRGVPAIEAMLGGGTIWREPEAWLEHCPSFNFHRVQGAFMLQVGSISSLRFYQEFRAGFFLNRRPFEWLVFPEAGHNLRRPRQRIASMQAALDWMAFWLKGEENGDPALSDRNARWKRLRDLWNETQIEEARGNFPGARGDHRVRIGDYFD